MLCFPRDPAVVINRSPIRTGPRRLLRPANALIVASAMMFSACGTTSPPPIAPEKLPQVVVPVAERATYTRCYQTEPDTYLLQTGYRTFKPKSGRGPVIELLGAAHIGEADYYAALQRRMDQSDAVLYEMVTDEKNPANPLTPEESAQKMSGSAYNKLAGLLNLSSQKACLRYDRKHFYRCDMTVQQMQALLAAEKNQGGKQESEAKRAEGQFSNLSNAMRGRSWLLNFGFWAANKLPALKARLKFAMVVNTPSSQEEISSSSRLTQLINADRNAHVLRELPTFIAKHPKVKHLVIFYGSAHLPGLADGLAKRGYTPDGPIRWLTVARCHPQADGLDPSEIQQEIADARNKK